MHQSFVTTTPSPGTGQRKAMEMCCDFDFRIVPTVQGFAIQKCSPRYSPGLAAAMVTND